MAPNAASHDIPGVRTGTITGQPFSLSNEDTTQLVDSSKQKLVGQHLPDQDGGKKDIAAKAKSVKELEKERQRAEKARKLAEKQAKLKNVAATGPADEEVKKKKEKSKEEKLPEYVEETPKGGGKKIIMPLDNAFSHAYMPRVVESAWYDWWEKEGFFQPEFKEDGNVQNKGYFVIPEPPPNVTGALHCGHVMAAALQDTMTRWSRMKGLTTLWVPGCDHAGISTQSVVEKMLW